MRTLLLAAALSSVGALATAQDFNMEEMRQAQTMLQTNVERLLRRHSIETNVHMLTLAQLAAIRGVAESSDSSDNLKGQIQAIVAR